MFVVMLGLGDSMVPRSGAGRDGVGDAGLYPMAAAAPMRPVLDEMFVADEAAVLVRLGPGLFWSISSISKVAPGVLGREVYAGSVGTVSVRCNVGIAGSLSSMKLGRVACRSSGGSSPNLLVRA